MQWYNSQFCLYKYPLIPYFFLKTFFKYKGKKFIGSTVGGEWTYMVVTSAGLPSWVPSWEYPPTFLLLIIILFLPISSVNISCSCTYGYIRVYVDMVNDKKNRGSRPKKRANNRIKKRTRNMTRSYFISHSVLIRYVDIYHWGHDAEGKHTCEIFPFARWP